MAGAVDLKGGRVSVNGTHLGPDPAALEQRLRWAILIALVSTAVLMALGLAGLDNPFFAAPASELLLSLLAVLLAASAFLAARAWPGAGRSLGARRAQALWSSEQEVLVVLDTHGQTVWASQAAQRRPEVPGVDPLSGGGWLEGWLGDTAEAAEQALVRAIRGESSGFLGHRAAAGGRLLSWDVELIPIPGPRGQTAEVLARFREVTDQLGQQTLLHQAQQALGEIGAGLEHALLITDRQGRVVSANTEAERLLGFTSEQQDTRSLWTAPGLDSHPEFEAHCRIALKQHEPRQFCSSPCGSEQVLRVVVRPLEDGLVVLARDASLEHARRVATDPDQIRLELAQSVAPFADWEMEVRTGDLKLSAGAFRLLGLAPAPGVSHREQLLSGLHPEDRRELARHLLTRAGAGEELDLRLRLDPASSTAPRELRLRGRAVPGPLGQPAMRVVGILCDITALKDAKARTNSDGVLMRTVFDALPERLCVLDSEGRVIAANAAWVQPPTAGPTGTEAGPLALVPGLLPAGWADSVRAGRVLDIDAESADREARWWRTRIAPLATEEGFAVLSQQDVTASREREQSLFRLAYFDAATGMPNRAQLWSRMQSFQVPGAGVCTLMLLRLGRLRPIIDSHGQDHGEQVLASIAERLRANLPAEAVLGRWSQEELAVLLPDAMRRGEIAQLTVKLLGSFEQPFDVQGHDVLISGHIGIAMCPEDGRGPEALVRNADLAVLAAQARGRNHFEFARRERAPLVVARLKLESRLYRALERNEFLLHYQPCFKAEDMSLAGVEALLRWQPQGEALVSPATFVPLLEETGLILPVGNWVVNEACRQMSEWKRGLGESAQALRLAINLSACQLQDERLDRHIKAAVWHHRLSPETVEIELTESTLIQDTALAQKFIDRLRRAGLRVAVDDFGTGYSSLSYLQRFRPDTLKLDHSFIAELHHDTRTRAIVTSIIGLGRALGVDVVAEGVEQEEQFELLRELGCSYLQGYLVGRPMSAAVLGERLESLLANKPGVRLLQVPSASADHARVTPLHPGVRHQELPDHLSGAA